MLRPNPRSYQSARLHPSRMPGSGLVAFPLRMPSLLLFDKQTRRGGSPIQARNLRSLFGVEMPPPDSCC